LPRFDNSRNARSILPTDRAHHDAYTDLHRVKSVPLALTVDGGSA